MRTIIVRNPGGEVTLSIDGENAPEEILKKFQMIHHQLFPPAEVRAGATEPKAIKKEVTKE